MPSNRLEYVGVTTHESGREYTLRLLATDTAPRFFVLVIAGEYFRAERARFQDGPDICYQKLQRELLACEGTDRWPDERQQVTEEEIEHYRSAHTPKPRKPYESGSAERR